MKKVTLSVFMLLCCTYFILSCKKTEDTTPPSNQQTTIPSSPSPFDAESNVSITPVLSWTCSGSDAGDSLKYDIYFDSINPPNTLIASGWKQPNFTLSILNFNTIYYWRVTAHDLKGSVAVGPIWRFTTISKLPSQGLIAYYPFNGNANDESGNGHNGTVFGNTILTTDRFGNSNHAFQFDGTDDYIEIENGLKISNISFSVSLWALMDQPKYAFNCILGQGPMSSNTNLHIGFRNNGSQKNFTFDFFNDGLNVPNTYTDAQLHHWVCTYDANSNERKAYRDGILVGNDISFSDYLGSGKLYIGIQHLDQRCYFHGSIDDIRIYNRSLTLSEIQQLYHEGGWKK